MKVGYVTTWNERCGLAAYTENVIFSMPEPVDFMSIGREMWPDMVDHAKECDLVHIMHHGGLMNWMTPEQVRACGKTVITRQCIGPEQVFDAAMVKTSHIKTDGYRFIPHGIRLVDESQLFTNLKSMPLHIGCAGIPFNGKGHLEAVEIAEKAGCGVVLVLPESHHTSNDLAEHIVKYCSENDIPHWVDTTWMPEPDVTARLSWATVNVFYYTRPANGISGAVRMGLASGRPMIVSDHSQFQDIIETGYVNVAHSIDEAAEMVRNHKDLITPEPLLEMWSFEKTSMMYHDLYREVLGA
jgi:hypothetical protein